MSQINHVENPIINSPFEAPKFHWYLEKGRQPEKRDGRRLASYFAPVPTRRTNAGALNLPLSLLA